MANRHTSTKRLLTTVLLGAKLSQEQEGVSTLVLNIATTVWLKRLPFPQLNPRFTMTAPAGVSIHRFQAARWMVSSTLSPAKTDLGEK